MSIQALHVAVHGPNLLYSKFRSIVSMIPQPPIPAPLWNTVPPEAQVAILALVDSLKGRVAELEQRVGDLEARLKLNSTNSSKPPSSDPIGFKRKPPTPPSGRKRGGQPGHRRAQRRLVPPEKVRTITECKPTDCRRCGHALARRRPDPLGPSSRRIAQDRAAGRRIPAPSPGLPPLRRHHLCESPRGGPHRSVSAPISRPCCPRSRAATASASARSSRWPATCSGCRSPRGWSPSSSGSRPPCWRPLTTKWRWASTTPRRRASTTPRGARTAARPNSGWP